MTKNPRMLSAVEFESEVRTAVSGASTPGEAEERIKQHFSPWPLVWVQKHGERHLGVLVQQFAGASNVSIFCEQ